MGNKSLKFLFVLCASTEEQIYLYRCCLIQICAYDVQKYDFREPNELLAFVSKSPIDHGFSD